MSPRKPSLLEIIMARLSQGAVPIDGMYWFERPKSTEPLARASTAGRPVVMPSAKPARAATSRS
jgi:hypothetical protein